MNCQEARESLSMLLEGALGLTERVPLEVHVNACDACQGQLAHLQELRELEQRARPTARPLHWRPILALGFVEKALGVMRAKDVTTRLRRLVHWRPVVAPGFVEKALGVMRAEDVTTRLRRLVHWRPVLASGFVEKALGVMRAEDVTTRLRRLVTEKVPSRQFAVAAAVPLLVMLAVFIFERGFTMGSAMRQRPAAPSQATSDLPVVPPVASIAPSSPTVVKSSVPAPVPPPPSVATQPVAPPPAVASQPMPPKPVLPVEKPRTAETKIAAARLPEPKAIDAKGAPRAARSGDVVKDEKASPPVAAKPAPAKPAAAAATNGSSDSNRKVARAFPDAHAPTKVAQTTTVPPSRRGMVDVAGRLQVKSRSDAERDLTALLASAGGTVVNRQRGASVTVLEAGIPHANYAKFAKGITRIGSWRVEAERSPLPDVVQVSVRLAE